MKLMIQADGGSRGNPGPAGSGSVVLDATGKPLATVSYVVGRATNNVAEYHGLLQGLIKARELGGTDIVVRMDSKLVVEQMAGRWKIKHPDMKELALKCQELVRQFNSVEFEWVPRAKNKLADELANKAMDALLSGAPEGVLESSENGSPSDVPASHSTASSEEQHETCPTTWNGAIGAPLRLILLRHGQTEMSAKRQYSGRSNPPLSEVGEQQAKAVAKVLGARGGINAVVASPLKRCQQTAHYAAEALGFEAQDVETLEELIELDFGAWEGLTFQQAHERDPELHTQWLQDPKVAPPGGESLQASFRRVKRGFEQLMERHAGKNVLVVSHVTPIKSLIRMGLGAPASVYHSLHLDLASISIVEFYPDGPTCVRCVNDTAHLRYS